MQHRLHTAAVLIAAGLGTWADHSLWLARCAAEERSGRAKPPNIVFILLDNCGKEWFGCYGSEERCTPHIDHLAATGVRVENCYTPTVCGPSRIVALTGRYLFRSGMTLHHDAALYSGGGLSPQREITFARLLRKAGYATGVFGKWQINNLYDEPKVVAEHGFDEYLLWPGSLDRDQVSPEEMAYFMQRVEANDYQYTSRAISKIESRYWDLVTVDHRQQRKVHRGRFGPDVFHEHAVDFLRRHREGPFLLYYPMVLTHGPSFLHPVVPTPHAADANRPHREMYADMVRYADHLVGALVKSLEELGLRDNTLIFVATDNGTEVEFSARANGRVVQGGLYQLNEAGGNVPLIVNCPALVPGGRTLRLADFSDLLPTFCELAGAALPADVEIDGRSLARVLRDPRQPEPRTWIYNQYGKDRVVSDGRYKLYASGALYDVRVDPDERRNLMHDPPAEAAAARDRLQAVLDRMPPDAEPPFLLRSQSAFRQRSGVSGAK